MSVRRTAARKARRRLWLRWSRLVSMAPTIAQCSVAAAAAWWVARDVLGHEQPFFAPIAVLICIGVSSGQRLRRVAELVVGVGVGIGIGDLLILKIGSGTWQLGVVVALALVTVVLVGSGSVMLTQAGSSAVLVATLVPSGGSGGWDRMADALLGGLLGILAICLMPPDVRGLAQRTALPVFEVLTTTLLMTAEAARRGDPARAAYALRTARSGDASVRGLHEALVTGREIVMISPLRRKAATEIGRYRDAAGHLDHAVRNSRVLARRTVAALRDGEPIPSAIPDGLEEMAFAVRLLAEELEGTRAPGRAREAVLHAAATVGRVMAARPAFSTQVIAAQVRSIGVDILRAAGEGTGAVAEAMPPIEDGARGKSTEPARHEDQPRRDHEQGKDEQRHVNDQGREGVTAETAEKDV